MGDKEKLIGYYADLLDNALLTSEPVDAITSLSPEIDIDDAYGIQMKNVEKALLRGANISGKKIGLTSLAMQQMMGVNEPDYGHLYDTMYRADGKVNTAKMLQPKAEGEIAFILKEDLTGPDVTAADVLAATDYVVAAIEIVDSRVRDWKIELVDTVSDNASSGLYVLGDKKVSVSELSLPDVEMTFYKNDEVENTGNGAAVLGDPALCVAWLANKLWKYGVTLKKGEVILSGALSAAVAAGSGDVFRAEFSSLGSVSVKFV